METKAKTKAKAAADVKYPELKVRLSGQNGNIFNLAALVGSALKRHGVAKEEVDAFYAEVTASGSYGEALGVLASWVRVS